MLILDALESGPLGLAALADVTALPRATAHRLAHALEVHGLVGRDRNGRFELGRAWRAGRWSRPPSRCWSTSGT